MCFQKFETDALVRAHQKKIHNGDVCDICGSKFVHMKSMKRHILVTHVNVPECNVKCNSCDMKFVDLKALGTHIRTKHTYKPPFQCNDCGKTFIKESYYKAHERSHAEDKFVCDICSQEFDFKPYLQTHMKNIHGRT